jgi:FkbM family methyltransferase
MMEYAKNKIRIVDEEVDGLTPWVWTATDQGLWGIIKAEWPHLKTMWGKHVKKYDVCVQAGGACGMYPRLLAETFKRVYTFEPDPLSFYCLVNNCQSADIYKYHAAVGDNHRMVKLMRKSPYNVGENFISDEGDYSIPTMMIDDLTLEACDFIQLDVEGYELNTLKGASNTIKQYHPVISVENGTDDILNFLKELAPYEQVDKFVIPYDPNRSDDVYKVL